jgi:hypothetical protein
MSVASLVFWFLNILLCSLNQTCAYCHVSSFACSFYVTIKMKCKRQSAPLVFVVAAVAATATTNNSSSSNNGADMMMMTTVIMTTILLLLLLLSFVSC